MRSSARASIAASSTSCATGASSSSRRRRISDPADLIGVYGRAALFGAHPFARPVGGSEESLAAISHQDVLDYYDAQIGADRLILIVSGDVDVPALKRDVTQAFGSWRRASAQSTHPAEPPRIKGRSVLLVDSPESAQTYFWLANVGVNKRYPQHAALDLVNTLYGGRFTSILNTELRIKSGLSYSARAGFARGTVAGEFAIRSFTDTENTGRAIDLSLETLTRLKRDGVTLDMLESARAYILGQYPLGFETSGGLGRRARGARVLRAGRELHRRLRVHASRRDVRGCTARDRFGLSEHGRSDDRAHRRCEPHPRRRAPVRSAHGNADYSARIRSLIQPAGARASGHQRLHRSAGQRGCAARRLESIKLTHPFLLRTFDPPIAELNGLRVEELRRVGKRIALRFENGYWLVIHLMIAGRLHWFPAGGKKSARQALATFTFDNGTLTLTEAGTKRRASLSVFRDESALAAARPGRARGARGVVRRIPCTTDGGESHAEASAHGAAQFQRHRQRVLGRDPAPRGPVARAADSEDG